MIKNILIILALNILILFPLTILKINNTNINNSINRFKIINNHNNDKIGYIKIKTLNINEPLYKIDSEENNVDKHITILKESIFPDKDNSIIFIAAHSGEGKIAYFNELNKLKIDDKVIIKINNKKYTYLVKEMWEEKKNGFINVNKEPENQLILTTCSPIHNNYQLIVNCIEKESN